MVHRQYFVIARRDYGYLVNNPLHAGLARWGLDIEESYIFSSRQRAEAVKELWAGQPSAEIKVMEVKVTVEVIS
jgi:hypothetical protein